MPCAAVDQRMGAAGIVAEHAADAAAVAGRCLRAEMQSVRLEGKVELVPHHTRLHAGPPLLLVDLQDLVPPLDVNHNPLAHDLPGHGSPGRTGDEAGVQAPGFIHQLNYVLRAFRIRHAPRHLPIDGGIRRVGNLVQRVGVD